MYKKYAPESTASAIINFVLFILKYKNEKWKKYSRKRLDNKKSKNGYSIFIQSNRFIHIKMNDLWKRPRKPSASTIHFRQTLTRWRNNPSQMKKYRIKKTVGKNTKQNQKEDPVDQKVRFLRIHHRIFRIMLTQK